MQVNEFDFKVSEYGDSFIDSGYRNFTHDNLMSIKPLTENPDKVFDKKWIYIGVGGLIVLFIIFSNKK